MSTTAFGIDLGTSNSAIAYLNALGEPKIRDNLDGDPTTPSVVWFQEARHTIVGKVARDEKMFSPDEVVDLVKRHMGRDTQWEFHGQRYTPESISALVLRALAELVEDGPGPIPAVITIPAYFGAREREATRAAGTIAGLDVLELIAEPVAAALFYDSVNDLRGRNLLVYDLGGGTFDVTAVRGTEGSFEILATEGDPQLGGADWDEALREHLLDRFIEETGAESAEEDIDFLHRLHEQAVVCKEALSQSLKHTVRLQTGDGTKAKFTVTREEFEEVTAPKLKRTAMCMERLFDVVQRKDPDFVFHEVILVGGSSRMPAVAELVRNRTYLEPQLFEPDLAVAKGAAIAATISGLERHDAEGGTVAEYAERSGIDSSQLATLSTKTVINALPKAIGVSVLDVDGTSYIDFLAEQHTPIPLQEEVVRDYLTAADDQTRVNLTLYQQASDIPSSDPNLCEVITGSETMLTGIPPRPRGERIRVRLSIAGDGLITIRGTHVASGADVEAQVRIGVLSSEEVEAARMRLTGMRVSQTEDL